MENRFLDFMISHKMNFKPFEKNYSLYEWVIFYNHYLLLDGIWSSGWWMTFQHSELKLSKVYNTKFNGNFNKNSEEIVMQFLPLHLNFLLDKFLTDRLNKMRK